MSVQTFIDKYKKQFKAMAPDYDVPFDYSKETPVEFQNPDAVSQDQRERIYRCAK